MNNYMRELFYDYLTYYGEHEIMEKIFAGITIDKAAVDKYLQAIIWC